MTEKLRYSELRREMYNITDAVLDATLKDLIEDGIIDRKSYDEIPPGVEYMLTQKGKSVVPILRNICQWSGIFYKEDTENEMVQCQKCDHQNMVFRLWRMERQSRFAIPSQAAPSPIESALGKRFSTDVLILICAYLGSVRLIR